MQLHTLQQDVVTLTDILGKGGEATVYAVREYPNQVAKVYHQPTPTHEAKLQAMLAYPPKQTHVHTAIAWPTELLYEVEGQFVGCLMPKVKECHPIFEIYHPTKRAKLFPHFTLFHLLRTASNLAAATHAVHGAGHVIGDMNESNLLVNKQTLITLVDTDSFQITTPNGEVYRCEVGKAEYTPPELQKQSFREVTRLVSHDNFGLGVLIFQLLMQGFHPFAGTLVTGESVGRVDLYGIREGIFPYGSRKQMTPPRGAPEFSHLSPTLQGLFRRCFVMGHHHPFKRPEAGEWARALLQAEKEVLTCKQNPQHLYFDHLEACPYCVKRSAEAIGVSTPSAEAHLHDSMATTTASAPVSKARSFYTAFIAALLARPPYVALTVASVVGVAVFIWSSYAWGQISLLLALLAMVMTGTAIHFSPEAVYQVLALQPIPITVRSRLSVIELRERLEYHFAPKHDKRDFITRLFTGPPPHYEGNLYDDNSFDMKMTMGAGKNRHTLTLTGVFRSEGQGSILNINIDVNSGQWFLLLIFAVFVIFHPFGLFLALFSFFGIRSQVSEVAQKFCELVDGQKINPKQIGQGN